MFHLLSSKSHWIAESHIPIFRHHFYAVRMVDCIDYRFVGIQLEMIEFSAHWDGHLELLAWYDKRITYLFQSNRKTRYLFVYFGFCCLPSSANALHDTNWPNWTDRYHRISVEHDFCMNLVENWTHTKPKPKLSAHSQFCIKIHNQYSCLCAKFLFCFLR